MRIDELEENYITEIIGTGNLDLNFSNGSGYTEEQLKSYNPILIGQALGKDKKNTYIDSETGNNVEYYFLPDRKEMVALLKTKPDYYTKISQVNFKENPTYDSYNPALSNSRVLQVARATTNEQYYGYRFAAQGYLLLMNKGYIVCTDVVQSDAGRDIWLYLIREFSKDYGFSKTESNTGKYSIYINTELGILTRDVDTKLARPIVQTKRSPEKTSVPYDFVYHLQRDIITRPDELRSRAVMLAGLTPILNSIVNQPDVKKIPYSQYKEMLKGSTQLMNRPFMGQIPSSFTARRQQLIQLIKNNVIQSYMNNPNFTGKYDNIFKTADNDWQTFFRNIRTTNKEAYLRQDALWDSIDTLAREIENFPLP